MLKQTSQAQTGTARGIETRTRLLDQAERLFSERGFHGVSLTEIATTCRLGNAGLLHHFPSKAKLYRAVLERVAERLADRVETAFRISTSPKERLQALIRDQAESSVDYPEGSRLVFRELMENMERVEHAQSLPLKEFVARFCSLIEDAQNAGIARNGPAIAILTNILGALAYAQIARPTFSRMHIDDALLADDRRWMDAVATQLEQAIFV
ncbi:MAG: TetR family transcriptional regulator [Parvibaculum sp.]|uniref:TetR/AcrR family transcriptional regulator n=1 Tax=Parvibaculum sp. TaxID=2024848 RepID=UPI003C71A3FC